MPCVSASLTAAFHSGAGIGDRFVRVARQRLIRAPISVTSAAISGRFFARMSHPPRRAWMAPRYVRRYARVTHPCRRDTVLGCEILIKAANNLTSIQLGESILSALEAFLATSLGKRVVPYR